MGCSAKTRWPGMVRSVLHSRRYCSRHNAGQVVGLSVHSYLDRYTCGNCCGVLGYI